MKENRIKKIFEILTDDFAIYTANDISEIINVSSKTVRNYIKELNYLLKDNGAVIKSKSGVGYKFIINDKKKFYDFIKEDRPKYATDEGLNSQEYRVNKIILSLIYANDYVKSDDLAKILYVSKSQLNKDLSVVKNILYENQIEIISKPYYGIKIKSDELHIRLFLVNYVEENAKVNKNILEDISNIGRITVNQISSFILEQFKIYGFDTNLVKFNSFLNYLIISVSRVRSCHLISNDNKNTPMYENYSSIYKLSCSITEGIKKICKIELDRKEIEYIYINLLSIINSYIHSDYNQDIEEIIDRSLFIIKNNLSVNLQNDLDLKQSLIIHIQPMIKRIKYGINLKNPLLDDIRKDHLAIECAKILAYFLTNFYNIDINEDELGYISLHFSAAIAKSRENINKKNILLICASGKATAKILKYRFMHEFSKYINILDTSDYLFAMNMDLSNYDLIISTIPINLNTNVPVIEVSAYLYKNDISKILNFIKDRNNIEVIKSLFNKNIFIKENESKNYTRDQVIKKIISNVNYKVDKKSLYKEIINREKLASTGLENRVAIPHPLKPVTDKNFIGIYISENEIDWSDKKINIVILLNLNDNIDSIAIENFYRLLNDFLNDNRKIIDSIKSNNLEEFLNIFFN